MIGQVSRIILLYFLIINENGCVFLTYLYRRLFMSLRNKVNMKKKIKRGLGSLLVLTEVSTGIFVQANAVKADEQVSMKEGTVLYAWC